MSTVGELHDLIELYVGNSGINPERLNPVLVRKIMNMKMYEFLRETGYGMMTTRLTSVASQQEYQLPTHMINVQRCDFDGETAVKVPYDVVKDMYSLTAWSPEAAATTGTFYTWKHVALSDTTEHQLLTTGSGELVSDNLDTSNTLPTFTTTDDYAVEITRAYQDRFAYISTDEYVTSGNLAFGIKLSAAGVAATPYFDITIKRITP